MKVTMQDVANHAGVDKATVSRVLRGDHRISEKTKIKVMESIRALDYKIDRNARSLSTNSSGLVGVVVRALGVPWLGAFLAGIDRAFSNSEYEILLKATEANETRARRIVGALGERHVEGLIWCDAENPPRAAGIPILCVGFAKEGEYSVTAEGGGDPTFETGAMVGRMMLKILAGRPLPGRDIRIVSPETGDRESLA